MSESTDNRPAVFSRIRAAVQAGNLAEAKALLDGVPERGAEWFFLMGAVHYRRGWMDEALRHYETAARMEPDNPEYRRAVEQMRNGAHYRPGKKPFGTLFAEGACLGLGAAYVLCQACGLCGACGGCYTCLRCIDGMPR